MKSYTTLLIDDEKLARERLRKLLASFHSTFIIIGEGKNGNEAEKLIQELRPDIIFLDIEMPGKNGFELLSGLSELPIVIFCTAYEEYALKAFDTNSIDYLVKPVKPERLESTVKKINSLQNNLTSAQLQRAIQEISKKKKEKVMTSITVKKKDRIVFIKLEKVSYLEAKEKYVVVHTDQGEELTEISLSKLISKLPENFIQIHRKYILNTNYIKDLQKYFNSRYIVTLHDKKQTQLISGRSFKKELMTWMEM
jgi:two-component system LytT family response regulator